MKRKTRKQLIEKIESLEAHIEILEHFIAKNADSATYLVKMAARLREMK